jgi:hypothetical protein
MHYPRAMLTLLVLTAALPACRADDTDPAATVDHKPFDALLQEHVRDERVDYLVWRRDDADKLGRCLDRLAAVNPAKLPKRDQLAFYINLYNATMIQAVLNRLDAEWTPADNDFKVFDEPLVRLRGKRVSLNHVEHEIIRKRFKDPRIHAALVCAAESCPPLRAAAYEADDLDRVLEAKMQAFIRDSKRNGITDAKVELSQIFEWYADDFGGKQRLTHYLESYTHENLSRAKLTFRKYSWKLNMAPPADGNWVRVTAKRATLHASPDGDATNQRVAQHALLELLAARDEWRQVRLPDGQAGWLPAAALAPLEVK